MVLQEFAIPNHEGSLVGFCLDRLGEGLTASSQVQRGLLVKDGGGRAVFSRGHATLHLAVSVGPSVRPSVVHISKLRSVFALLLLPYRPRLDCRVSGLVITAVIIEIIVILVFANMIMKIATFDSHHDSTMIFFAFLLLPDLCDCPSMIIVATINLIHLH